MSRLPVSRLLGYWQRRMSSHGYIRTPLISFPRRRTPDGKPLVVLSVERLLRSPGGVAGDGPQQSVVEELPVGYGRKPLTAEEVELINLGGAVS